MIRVLQVGFTGNLGGIEMLIMNVYRNIDREKIQFDFIDDCNGIYFEKEIKEFGGKIIKIPTRRENLLEYRRILKKLMKSGEYAYVHCNCLAVANIDIAKFAYRYGKTQVIIHSHQDMKLRHLKSEILHRYNRRWLANRNIIRLACSEQAAIWIHGNKVTQKGQVLIVKNAINVRKFKYNEDIERQYRKELQLEGKFVVGCVGRFAYQKNYEFLGDVFSSIKKKKNNAILICVGDEGGMKETVLNHFKELGIMDSVRLLGIRQDVEKIMQTFDVFVLPSRWEGLGIVYIEAQAAGIQTFASDVVPKEANVTELMHYISLFDTPEKWADQIIKYGNNYKKEDTTNEIKNQGYDIVEMAKKMEELYLDNLL